MTENARIIEIVHFYFPVFRGVTVDTQIVPLQKRDPANWRANVTFARTRAAFETGGASPDLVRLEHDQDRWRSLDGGVINILLSEADVRLSLKIAGNGAFAASFFNINVGIKPYQVGKGTPPQTRYVVDTRPFDSDRPETERHRRYLRGGDIGRYVIQPREMRYLKYGPWLAEPRPAANFDAPAKILVRQAGDSIVAAIDREQHLCLNNLHVLVPRDPASSVEYCLGLLNSKLLNWYYQTLNPEMGEALAEVKRTNVAALPIYQGDLSHPADLKRHNKMVELVQSMMALNISLAECNTPHERGSLERAIKSTDRMIDDLVYELFGLTQDEIAVVESGSERR